MPGKASAKNFKPLVTAAIVEKGHILAVREGSGAHHQRWNLPGGKLDLGEHLTDAVAREVREETGYKVEVEGLFGVYSYVNLGKHCLRFVFLAHVTGGEPRCGKDILDLRWFDLSQMLALPDRELSRPKVLREMLTDLREPKSRRSFPIREFQQIVTV